MEVTDAFWQYAIGPVSAAIGVVLTAWWQRHHDSRSKQDEAMVKRYEQDLEELRAYRRDIETRLQTCYSSEQILRADLSTLQVKQAELQAQVASLSDDLAQALSALKEQTAQVNELTEELNDRRAKEAAQKVEDERGRAGLTERRQAGQAPRGRRAPRPR